MPAEWSVCPDNAVIKLDPGKRYGINLDYCRSCGICVSERLPGAIRVVPEIHLTPLTFGGRAGQGEHHHAGIDNDHRLPSRPPRM